uniref:hypothetical protein n=1 Tax=Prevotella sp. TaxID=59823 RepID=UPI004024B34A
MKKNYIQPNVSVSFVVVESQLLAGSGTTGAQKEQNDDFITFSKQHDFTDDSFDNTAWPKGKSPWED